MYSAAWYENPGDSLETAQIQKLDRICRKLQLGPGDHVLEIGTGWGGFAAFAATRYGCRVTTTTISREQYGYAAERFSQLGAAGDRITLLASDYRALTGRYDKIVSIEMFEAVGLRYYDDFFAACDRLLAPDGTALLQCITMNEQDFPIYRKTTDWMQTYIFPGSELAAVSEMLASIGRVTSFRPFHLEDMGTHYARTLHEWRARFLANLDGVRRLGMDDRFSRAWDLYLAFCEAAFAERHISCLQLLLTRGYHDRLYFTDAGAREMTAAQPATI
jgi:cyclopropane-fatty-acyl-phospholipid synthase